MVAVEEQCAGDWWWNYTSLSERACYVCAHGCTKCVCVCVYACVCGEKGGALNRGPSSPDLKRHSFIIANLPNINMRASTQSLSQGRGGDPPMTGDEGPHERRTVRAPGRPTVCVTESCTGCINQSRYQFYNSCLWTDLFFFFLWACEKENRRVCACVCARVFITAKDVCVPVLLGKSGSKHGARLDMRDSFLRNNRQLVIFPQ